MAFQKTRASYTVEPCRRNEAAFPKDELAFAKSALFSREAKECCKYIDTTEMTE